jgi:hypothetical protein
MPLFVDPLTVIQRMQLNPDLDGVYDTVCSGIQGAQRQVQAVLQSELELKTRTHIYQCDSDAFSGIQPGKMYRLEVPSGLIRNSVDYPVSITVGSSWQFTDGYTPDPSTYVVDYWRGYVLMDARVYHDKFVRIVCTTGFITQVPTPSYEGDVQPYSPNVLYTAGQACTFGEPVPALYACVLGTLGNVDPTDDTYWTAITYSTEDIPGDLEEGIMSYVPWIFDVNQTTNRNADATAQYKAGADHGLMVLRPYLRLKGFSFRPLFE